MPRKVFVADLQESIRSFCHERLFDVGTGSEDGSIVFKYALKDGPASEAAIQALVTGK